MSHVIIISHYSKLSDVKYKRRHLFESLVIGTGTPIIHFNLEALVWICNGSVNV